MSETKKEYNIWTSFTDAIKKYFQLKGRANRYEYWGFSLMSQLIILGFSILPYVMAFALVSFAKSGLPFVWIIYGLYIAGVLIRLFLFIPAVTAGVRRLHDINRSGWWFAVPFIMIALLLVLAAVFSALEYAGIDVHPVEGITFVAGGAVIILSFLYLLYLLCKKSVNEGNKYGEINKEAKEDKYGKKFIWIYFVVLVIPAVIIGGYDNAMKKDAERRAGEEYFIPRDEYENMQIQDTVSEDIEDEIILREDMEKDREDYSF